MTHPFPERSEAVLADLLERRAATHPDKLFLLHDGGEWTYGETAERAWSAADGLVELGVQPGDYVLSWLPTGVDAVQAWLGINAAGGVYTPLNTSYKGNILERAVNLSRASTMIVHSALVSRLDGLALTHLRTLVVVGEQVPTPPGMAVVDWRQVSAGMPVRPRLATPREPYDDMAVIFTSGTTGVSKGVRCSYMHHYTYGANLFPPELGADDRYYLCLPLYHAAATNATYTFLRRGGSIAVVESFNTERFWADVRRFGATCGNLATSMSAFLHNAPRRPDDADNPMRMAYMGPMLEDTEGFCERFGMQVFSCYGSTEVPGPLFSGPVTTNTGSVGRLAGPGFQGRIVDEHDIEVPTGMVGELVVRHDQPWAMFSGYLGMPEQDAAVWRNGWFHTGDAMRVDAEGNYYFSDRIRDTIRRRAENISSVEVEAEILGHPSVAEVAVIAVPSEHEEDEVMAYVVPAPGGHPAFAELVDHAADRLPYFMVPRYWELVDELPKTPTFKVQKAQLRQIGITPQTWDREAAGYRLRRERFTSGSR